MKIVFPQAKPALPTTIFALIGSLCITLTYVLLLLNMGGALFLYLLASNVLFIVSRIVTVYQLNRNLNKQGYVPAGRLPINQVLRALGWAFFLVTLLIISADDVPKQVVGWLVFFRWWGMIQLALAVWGFVRARLLAPDAGLDVYPGDLTFSPELTGDLPLIPIPAARIIGYVCLVAAGIVLLITLIGVIASSRNWDVISTQTKWAFAIGGIAGTVLAVVGAVGLWVRTVDLAPALMESRETGR